MQPAQRPSHQNKSHSRFSTGLTHLERTDLLHQFLRPFLHLLGGNLLPV